MKILITGGNNAKAMKLLKAFPQHFVLLADYGDVPAMITENYALTTIGELNKESIAHILLNFCLTQAIDSIIPLHDFEIKAIAQSSVLFGEYGIDVLLPHADIVDDYLNQSQEKWNDWGFFVKGECVFATSTNYNAQAIANLNGLYTFDTQDFKLFTI